MEEKGLTTEQIYNANETGLLWKCLPDRTLVSCREKSALGFKKSKDRLTVLGCTNATGTHKLKPVTPCHLQVSKKRLDELGDFCRVVEERFRPGC